MLEKKLAGAERKIRNRRMITTGMWIATAICFFTGLGLSSHLVPVGLRPMGTTLMMLSYGLFYLSLLRLFMYLAFERRTADTVRNETRDALLMELTRKIDAISQRLDALNGGLPAK